MKTISIDFSKIESIENLHNLLKTKLNFPDYYGMNWDAFWDSITGLIEMPDKIEITGWMHLRKILPEDSEKFLHCLLDYNDQSDLKTIEVDIK